MTEEEFVFEKSDEEMHLNEKYGFPLGRWLYLDRKVIGTTWEHHHEILNAWNIPFWVLADLYKLFGNHYFREELEKDMVFHFLKRMPNSALFIKTTILRGFYEPALRELRYVLENLLQSIYIDKKMGNASLDVKCRSVSMIEDSRFRGAELVKKCDLILDIKKKALEIYQKLSAYVHPSQVQIEKILDDEIPWLRVYNGGRFKYTSILYLNAFDLVLSLLLSSYPKTIRPFLESKAHGNTALESGDCYREVLEGAGYSLTLSLETFQLG
ncbi:MAG: hypothetical protein ACTSUO_02730 [Candidatus Thorarchaeota archaeon]